MALWQCRVGAEVAQRPWHGVAWALDGRSMSCVVMIAVVVLVIHIRRKVLLLTMTLWQRHVPAQESRWRGEWA